MYICIVRYGNNSREKFAGSQLIVSWRMADKAPVFSYGRTREELLLCQLDEILT